MAAANTAQRAKDSFNLSEQAHYVSHGSAGSSSGACPEPQWRRPLTALPPDRPCAMTPSDAVGPGRRRRQAAHRRRGHWPACSGLSPESLSLPSNALNAHHLELRSLVGPSLPFPRTLNGLLGMGPSHQGTGTQKRPTPSLPQLPGPTSASACSTPTSELAVSTPAAPTTAAAAGPSAAARDARSPESPRTARRWVRGVRLSAVRFS